MIATFEELLVILAQAKVDFIVVGGLAVTLAGYPRLTEDVDLLVKADPANINKMLTALGQFGEGHAQELDPSEFVLEEGALRVGESFDIDLFTLMSGHRYQDLKPLSVEHVVQNERVLFLGADGLIRLKADSLRPKDQIDVQMLRQAQTKSRNPNL